MRAIVTIFKHELSGREFLKTHLAAHCAATAESKDVFIFVPKIGRLDQLLALIRSYHINYVAHFDTKEKA